jgi:hypothetical protein
MPGDSVWVPSDHFPPPAHLTVNGIPEASGMATKATYSVRICGDLSQALANGGRNRIYARWSGDNWQSYAEVRGPWINWSGTHFEPTEGYCVQLTNLVQNIHYEVRVYAERPQVRSKKFNSTDFWTNRQPNLPILTAPAENATFLTTSPVDYAWTPSDPDPNDPQASYELRWREVSNGINPPGLWVTAHGATSTTRQIAAGTYLANRDYEWQVRSRDPQGMWGGWSLLRSFHVEGTRTPPQLLAPVNGTVIDMTDSNAFTWKFSDPDPGDTQADADIRYRAVGTNDWIVLVAKESTDPVYYTAPQTFYPNVHYEWQARTYDALSGGSIPSEWSDSAHFYTVGKIGGLLNDLSIAPDISIIQGELGCGHHRVFIYEQGGERLVGEINSLSQIQWTRKRDDISNCLINTTGFDEDCGRLLGEARSWQHELVVFRDEERVWEGPITRITYQINNVEIEAKDVMNYVYRRVMRQGYNDSYHCLAVHPVTGDCLPGAQLGLSTVVNRAARIIIDALGRGDPNVLGYLTILTNAGDARQSRIVADYSKTAWEEVDDLAATAGLDYVTVGRRIILWDTHNPIGKLPEMRDEHFSDPVIVTEYGMNLANYFAVTDGNGVWGAAYPLGTVPPDQPIGAGQVGAFGYYGPIEQLASSYGDSDAGAAEDPTVLTPEALAQMQASMARQAARNIAHRWTTPLIVRVPDNSSIHPGVNLGINQLIPGVWIPLRATQTNRTVAQWQKLDSVTVIEDGTGEKVQVVMSPAPNGGDDDPDATGLNTT